MTDRAERVSSINLIGGEANHFYYAMFLRHHGKLDQIDDLEQFLAGFSSESARNTARAILDPAANVPSEDAERAIIILEKYAEGLRIVKERRERRRRARKRACRCWRWRNVSL